MTPDELSHQQRRRICNLLPWGIAVAGLVVYLATLNHWASFGSLALVSQISGWDWLPPAAQPVTFLVTLPLKLLPASVLPFTLNFLTALAAAGTLWLLARSIAILPRDRLASFRGLTSANNSWELPLAWLPPVLAAVAFGLQFTFWEHATVGTGEVFDLLLLAYVVRSILEYRHTGRDKWLDRALLVAALAATNNYAALAYLPLVLIAVWWVKGYEFLESRFLLRVGALLAAGLSLYFLHPLLAALRPEAPFTFTQTFKQNLGGQFNALIGLLQAFYYAHRDVALLLALVSFLPLLFMSVRWRSFSGGSLHTGAALVTLPFHIAHAAIFGICLWVFLDPPFGPRVAGQKLGMLPYLSVYYLAALAVGYYGGYFLQFFADYPPEDWAIGADTRRKIARLVRGVGLFLLVAVPVVLIGKNLPAIRHQNSDLILRQAQEMARGLPEQGCVFLSDDPLRLALTQAALAREGKLKAHIPLDTRILGIPKYLTAMHRRHPQRLPLTIELPKDREAEPVTVLGFLAGVAQTNTVCYLHPSFGYYFEAFYLEPRGPVFTLRPHETNSLYLPVTPANILASSEKYWTQLAPNFLQTLTNRVGLAAQPPRNAWTTFLRKLRIRPEPDNIAYLLGSWQSRQLTAFAVELQRSGQFEAAGRWFREALALKRDNLSAAANLLVNTNLLAHQPIVADRSQPPEAYLGRNGSWEQAITENGPFDHPDLNYPLGMVFAANSLYRQAAGQFHRAYQLDPSFTPALLMLSSIYGLGNRWDDVLSLVNQVRTNRGYASLTPNEKTELAIGEAGAYLGRGDLARADALIASILDTRTNEPAVLDRLFALYTSGNHLTNALKIATRQQAASPTNEVAFINEGYVWMQLGLYTNALPVLTRALAINSNNVHARFNRAFAALRVGQYEASRADYQFLDDLDPTVPRVLFGLGEVAYARRETNEAIRQFTRYLSNAPPNSAEIKYVQDRLHELEPARK